MDGAHISVDDLSVDQFECPVCLDLLKDPVTLPCGQSYCNVCINGCWDQEDVKGVYSCPQCTDTFTSRPVLGRNNTLAEVVEKVQAASSAHFYSEPGEIVCDFCSRRKHKAVKSCLVCLTSFCQTHLKPHLELPGLKKHTLIEASSKLQEKICSQHDKLIEIYCRTDQRCICSACILENHRGHDAVSLSAERTEKQRELKEEQMKFQQKIQEKQKKVHELKQAVNTIKSYAQTAVDDSERIFTEMISSMERKRSEVTELIRDQEKAELSRVEQLLEQQEQEIVDLKRRVTKLEQLSNKQDHIHFLQNFQSLCVSSGCKDSPSITVHQHLFFDSTRNSLSNLKKQFGKFCEKIFDKIPSREAVESCYVPHRNSSSEWRASEVQKMSKSREDFLKYFCYLTLDPNTAHCNLSLSKRNRVVTCSGRKQMYRDHTERFDSFWQVLCKESMCGSCYWEVDWSHGLLYISVSYKGIRRKGEGTESEFGHNSQSWSLCCSSFSLSFYHNDIKTDLGVPSSSRIGVCVDHNAGSLSFYSVSDTMRLIHSVHTTFTQPLYAGFGLYGGTVSLCDPKYQ